MKAFWMAGALALVTLALSPARANAQATLPGPYYPHPAWDQKLPPSTRFIILSNWDNEAVLDRETGLVWQRTPSNGQKTLIEAQFACAQSETGGRLGWRLPAISELASLLDRSLSSDTKLPIGHPFIGVALGWYWSATPIGAAGQLIVAFVIDLENVLEFGDESIDSSSRSSIAHYWCVRGGAGDE